MMTEEEKRQYNKLYYQKNRERMRQQMKDNRQNRIRELPIRLVKTVVSIDSLTKQATYQFHLIIDGQPDVATAIVDI